MLKAGYLKDASCADWIIFSKTGRLSSHTWRFCGLLRGSGHPAGVKKFRLQRPRAQRRLRRSVYKQGRRKRILTLAPSRSRTPGANRYRCSLSGLTGLAATPPPGSFRRPPYAGENVDVRTIQALKQMARGGFTQNRQSFRAGQRRLPHRAGSAPGNITPRQAAV